MKLPITVPPRALTSTSSSLDLRAWVDATQTALDEIACDQAGMKLNDLPRPPPGHLAKDPTSKEQSWLAVSDEATAAPLADTQDKGKGKEVDTPETSHRTTQAVSAWEGPLTIRTHMVELSATVTSKLEQDKRLGYSTVRLHSVLSESAPENSLWRPADGKDFDLSFQETHQHMRVKLDRPLKFTGDWQANEAWIELDRSLNWRKMAGRPLVNEQVEVTFFASDPGSPPAPLFEEARQAGSSTVPPHTGGTVYRLTRVASLSSDIRQKYAHGVNTAQVEVVLSLEDSGPTGVATKELLRRQWKPASFSGTVDVRSFYLVPRTDISVSGAQVTAVVLKRCGKSKTDLAKWTVEDQECLVSVITKDSAQESVDETPGGQVSSL